MNQYRNRCKYCGVTHL